MVVEFLYKEVMSAKVAETTKGETHKQQQITLFLFSLLLINTLLKISKLNLKS